MVTPTHWLVPWYSLWMTSANLRAQRNTYDIVCLCACVFSIQCMDQSYLAYSLCLTQFFIACFRFMQTTENWAGPGNKSNLVFTGQNFKEEALINYFIIRGFRWLHKPMSSLFPVWPPPPTSLRSPLSFPPTTCTAMVRLVPWYSLWMTGATLCAQRNKSETSSGERSTNRATTRRVEMRMSGRSC